MTRIGEILGRRRPQFGQGIAYDTEVLVNPPKAQDVIYPSFRMGLDMSDAPENLDLDRAVYALDMEATRNNRLVRSPGIRQISDETPRVLRYLFEQAASDYAVELVCIDPPWFGYYDSGGWHWVNAGISPTGDIGWNGLNYLGKLLFSNGVDATYYRDSTGAVVTDISADVIARTFVQQFGRIFAGAYVTGGNLEALGMMWNDTTATIDGWAGAGSGSELLLSPSGDADQIIATKPLGYDLIAILMRNSLWAGYPTGRDTRPADFRFRIGGVGCVSQPTVQVTPGGVSFLSDEGIVNYNANTAEVVSNQINAELLPLDYTRLREYKSAYIQSRRRYYLLTPIGLYIYEFPIPEMQLPGRWFKRSLTATSIASFTNQAAIVTWLQLVGTWAQQTSSWTDLGLHNWAAPPQLVVGKDTLFGAEDNSIATNFGIDLAPVWRTPQSFRQAATDQSTTLGWEIIYASNGAATVALRTPDANGDFNNEWIQALPDTGGAVRKRMIWNAQSGEGVQAQIHINSGSPEILRVRQIVQMDGPTQLALTP